MFPYSIETYINKVGFDFICDLVKILLLVIPIYIMSIHMIWKSGGSDKGATLIYFFQHEYHIMYNRY